jgi:hypothetical protein
MVTSNARYHVGYRVPLVATLLISLLLLAFSSSVWAQGLEDEYLTLEEEVLIEIDEVGDAHITDTITYDPAWFEEYGYIFEENPNLLSRRYRSDSNVGEVENFDVDIDDRSSTITISFDTPGYAYNMGDTWHIYGYGDYEAQAEDEDQVELGASWILTSEFTLFESMPLEEKVIIDLPEGTAEADFVAEKGAIEYELPYKAEGQGVLAGNKTLFIIIFALIMALSLFLFLFAVTRKAAMRATPVMAAPQTPGAYAGAPIETPKVPRFCKRCGQPRTDPESKFCKKCGAPFE